MSQVRMLFIDLVLYLVPVCTIASMTTPCLVSGNLLVVELQLFKISPRALRRELRATSSA